MAGHHAIKHTLFRPARTILGGGFAHDRTPAPKNKIGLLRFYGLFVDTCQV
jgi:hypothetical protein